MEFSEHYAPFPEYRTFTSESCLPDGLLRKHPFQQMAEPSPPVRQVPWRSTEWCRGPGAAELCVTNHSSTRYPAREYRDPCLPRVGAIPGRGVFRTSSLPSRTQQCHSWSVIILLKGALSCPAGRFQAPMFCCYCIRNKKLLVSVGNARAGLSCLGPPQTLST